MQMSVPISISVQGHPLIQTIAVSWSADDSMVPQALLFGSDGGTAEATLLCEDPEQVIVHYHARVSFTLPEWSVIETQAVATLVEGGQHFILDPGAWIDSLLVQFQSKRHNTPKAELDHLVVNLTWQGVHLSNPVRQAIRLTPSTSALIPYINDPGGSNIEATCSTFGKINGRLVQVSAQVLDLTRRTVLLDHASCQLIMRPGTDQDGIVSHIQGVIVNPNQ